MRTAHIPLALAAALVAAVALTGCSEEKKAAAPQLPERNCFGIFTRDDLEPLMGKGEEVKESGPVDVKLTAERRSATCNVDVDGEGRFLASATRQPLDQSFFWMREMIKPPPDPLDLGDEAIVYDTGARVAFSCKGPKDMFHVELTVSGSIEQMKKGESRPLFAKLIKKFVDVAKQQTQCDS
ncbi:MULTISPECIES: hypothetical protein [unclassified Streptomyces]|uniref:hypothetical protein n=1 Tax=unclassified Streptomyces TaxID=2593676 RepID=UPI001BEBE290|nr:MULTISPECIES: hypothetical protein [unclassified Streptomyces]MBT2404644.1 hypothetical protein [Streptomyces sp. ISL-21]MBT2610456.1 hypothetical protein [Streptomyces sp. ISL-87]